MKVGDKVYLGLEVEKIDESDNTFRGKVNNGNSFWFKKEAITQLPIQEGRWMLVSLDETHWKKRLVACKLDGRFVSFDHGSEVYVTHWKYAKEIPTKRKLTMQEIAEKFNEDVDNIEICTE